MFIFLKSQINIPQRKITLEFLKKNSGGKNFASIIKAKWCMQLHINFLFQFQNGSRKADVLFDAQRD